MIELYIGQPIKYYRNTGTVDIRRLDRGELRENVIVVKDNPNDIDRIELGRDVLCLRNQSNDYMLGYYTKPEEIRIYNMELPEGGRVISAHDGVCLYLSNSGEIGIYKLHEKEGRNIALDKVLEYSLNDDELNCVVRTLKMFVAGSYGTEPTVKVDKDNITGDYTYIFTGKTNHMDLSPRFRMYIGNPITGEGKGMLNLVIDKMPVPIRAVPKLAPLPVEAIEIRIGPQANNKVLELILAPLTNVSVDQMGNIEVETGVTKMKVTPLGAVTIDNAAGGNIEMNAAGQIRAGNRVGGITISPAGVIRISGTLLELKTPTPLTPQFCRQPFCLFTGAPLLTNKVPLIP